MRVRQLRGPVGAQQQSALGDEEKTAVSETIVYEPLTANRLATSRGWGTLVQVQVQVQVLVLVLVSC